MASKLVGQDKWIVVSDGAGTSEDSVVVNVQHIAWLSNDGAADITFSFDADTSSAAAFVLRSGEMLGYTPKSVGTLYFKSASGTQAFRFWGIA